MNGELTCGVDEAGRGPLAGPVFAAAVILPPGRRCIYGLRDSKLLTPERRDDLAAKIKVRAVAWAVASATVEEIDAINILRASLLAMRRALDALWASSSPAPARILIDGLHCPDEDARMQAIVGGDDRIAEISAASILAKTARDALMRDLHRSFPLYGFHHHKGYSTPEHLEALGRHGPCSIHRRSFEPVRILIQRTLLFE